MKTFMFILTLLFMTACTERDMGGEEIELRERDSVKRDGLEPAFPPHVDPE